MYSNIGASLGEYVVEAIGGRSCDDCCDGPLAIPRMDDGVGFVGRMNGSWRTANAVAAMEVAMVDYAQAELGRRRPPGHPALRPRSRAGPG